MKKNIILLLLLIVSLEAVAQTDSAVVVKEPKFKLKKNIRIGDKRLRGGDVYGAIDQYQLVLSRRPDQMKVAYKLAEISLHARDYMKAKEWFTYVMEKDEATYPFARYWQAMMMKMTGDYFEAKNQFLAFTKNYKGDDDQYRKWARLEAEGCDLAMELEAKPLKIDLIHLGDSINSAYSDVSPIMWSDSIMIYASLPVDTLITLMPGDTNAVDHHMKFYKVKKNGLEFGKAFPYKRFNQQGAHVANGTFSPDRKRFYFTVCNDAEYGKTHCEIYMSELDGGEWSDPESLGPEINDGIITNTQPAIGTYKDGQDVMYFVSNRPGGRGGMDIWYSILNSKGVFQEPKNAGAKINTDRDEATPFYDNPTGTLYFSSNGKVTMGGYDVYKTTGKLNKWSEPVNMGFPINGPTDDMYFYYSRKLNGGFVVSNRVGVISIKSPTCCDDIFAYEYQKTIDIAVKGYIYDEALPQYPLNGAKVALALTKYAGLDEDIMVNESGISNNEKYLLDLQPGNSYKLIAYKEGYLNQVIEFDTKDKTTSDTLTYNIYLKRIIKNKPYTLRNIYYEYNSSELNNASKASLDSLYKLLTENPGISVELSSHTDSRGSEEYNANLSQQRASNCVTYLTGKGIAAARLSAKGYGESDPLDECSAECNEKATEEGCPCHAKNRRTEFKITGEKNVDIIYKEE